jgi:hypothetical protein
MSTKTTKQHTRNTLNSDIDNEIQTYKSNSPAIVSQNNQPPKLHLPDFDSLMEISRLSDQIKFQNLKLEQKQLLLTKTKDDYRQKLLHDEQGIRTRIVTLKKRQNIGQIVEKIRQSEMELQLKLQARIDNYEPTKQLNKKQKTKLLQALINKVTNVN